MSTYLYRFIEVRKAVLKGSVGSADKLPETNVMIGDTYRIYNPYRYMRCTGNENGKPVWTELEKPVYKWVPCVWWSDTKYDGNTSEYDQKYTTMYSDLSGNIIHLYKHRYFANNGGAMRDRYISDSWHDYYIQKRGLPNDVSKEIAEEVKEEKYAYNITYATLSELNMIFEKDLDKLKGRLLESITKDNLNEVSEKLDTIMSLIKNEKNKAKKKKSEDDEYDEDVYESETRYLFDEELIEILCLSDEIAYIQQLATEAMSTYDGDDVRVIYYMC